MNYFYTNENLTNIMDRKNEGGVDWERYGFTVRSISRKGTQCDNGIFIETLFPIDDKTKFNKELGNLIKIGQDEDYFYRVLTEEEAKAKKEEFKKIKEAQKAALGGQK